jgi:hypothetical protein
VSYSFGFARVRTLKELKGEWKSEKVKRKREGSEQFQFYLLTFAFVIN